MAIKVFRKEDGQGRYWQEEYTDMLNEFLSRGDVILDRVEASLIDYWGYPKTRTIQRAEDIEERLEDALIDADAYFHDSENNYRFSYSFHQDDRLILETTKKEPQSESGDKDGEHGQKENDC